MQIDYIWYVGLIMQLTICVGLIFSFILDG